ncbi:MAG TPA: redox-active disulfide protein 2 [Clostridiales bacterium]|nr:redox-active disulfide protein 2 [Clostridiales bacterium]
MNIKVIGTGCDKCDQLYENTKSAIEELGLNANIEKVEDLMEMVKLGVMSSPSLMVDGKLVVSGRIVSKEKIIELISK